MANTRAKKSVFLIGETNTNISENNLPLNIDVLKYYYYIKDVRGDLSKKEIISCGWTKDFRTNCPNDGCVCITK